MCSTSNGEEPAAKAMNIEYEMDREGNYLFDSVVNISPLSFDEWIKQPIRNFDNYVSTTKQKIRVPTVIQAVNCTKIVVKRLRPTKENLLKRYGYKCAYTNKKLTLSNTSIDHVIPKSRWKELGRAGSSDSWDNLVPCDKHVNYKKGNKLNQEAGLKLLIKPSTPLPIPVSELITNVRSRDWELFLHK